MSALQETQLDALSWYKYGYVALTSLWVYDYVLCIPDSVTYIVESRWGLGTYLYLASSHLPPVFLLLGMLTVFQPDASYTICRFYDGANIYLGFFVLFFAECIFLLRTLAVYRNGRKWMVLLAIGSIAHIVPIIICCHKFASSVSGGCSIPGFIIHVDKKANFAAVATYSLLGIVEFEILLFLLYRAVNIHSSGWRIDNRLMSSILQQNLLYFGCNCAFFLALALTYIFLPYPVVHMVGLRSLLKLSWSHECTGTYRDRIVPSMDLSLSQRSWYHPQMICDGALSSESSCSKHPIDGETLLLVGSQTGREHQTMDAPYIGYLNRSKY